MIPVGTVPYHRYWLHHDQLSQTPKPKSLPTNIIPKHSQLIPTNYTYQTPHQPTHYTYQIQQQPCLCPPYNYIPISPPNFDYSNFNQQSSTTDVPDYYIATIEPSNPNPISFTQLYNDFPQNINFENFDTFQNFSDQLPVFETSTYPSTTLTPPQPT